MLIISVEIMKIIDERETQKKNNKQTTTENKNGGQKLQSKRES